VRLRCVERKLVSHDPRRRAILARIRWVWHHLPRRGVLLFFDVQPIPVKAYGGRRVTSAKRLVLEKAQKTRGFFYLFAAYEVNTGRRRWAFYDGKSSEYVCRFMKQLHRWYPDQQVWVVLDRDSPHPCKSIQTRREMRRLKLHWVTLPKGSPDDNPVETIFSDIQLMVLDNSNDPDVHTTQRRISQHLRRGNRRQNRWIHIPYLHGFHKD
jgi:transposase